MKVALPHWQTAMLMVKVAWEVVVCCCGYFDIPTTCIETVLLGGRSFVHTSNIFLMLRNAILHLPTDYRDYDL